MGDAALGAVPEECPVHERHRNPPPPRIVSFTPFPPFLSRPLARPPLPTTTASPGPAGRSSPPRPVPRPQTRAIPPTRNFARSASRTTLSPASIMARLTGTSTTVVSITCPPGRTPLVPRNSQSACSCRRLSSVRKPTREPVLTADHSAEQHQLYVLVVHQLLVDHQVAGDHGDPAAVQLPGQPVAVADCRGGRILLWRDDRCASRRWRRRKTEFRRRRAAALLHDRPAVHPREQAFLLQFQQVTADRGGLTPSCSERSVTAAAGPPERRARRMS